MAKSRHDQKWKHKGYKLRGVKFLLNTQEEEELLLREYQEAHKTATNLMIRLVKTKLDAGAVTEEQVMRKRDSKFAASLRDEKIGDLDALGLTKERQKRGPTFLALRIIRGYVKRNKKRQEKCPRLRKFDNIIVEDGVVGLAFDKMGIAVCGRDGKRARTVALDYTVPSSMAKYVPYLPKSFGGHLTRTTKRGQAKYHFTAKAKIEFEWSYQPVGPLGFDLNKTGSYFITPNEPILFDGKHAR
jgi:hypothetical protein